MGRLTRGHGPYIRGVLARRWSVSLDGDCGNVFFDEIGRIIVSTSYTVEARTPGGLSRITKIVDGPASTTTTYANLHARCCYAIELGGGGRLV